MPTQSGYPFDKAISDVIFDHLPKAAILTRYAVGRGKELSSGKFANPDSSSALVANAFGLFIEHPNKLRFPIDSEEFGNPLEVVIEKELRFPWRGGLHPWLDVVVETDTHLLGIESKRYEPFRDKKNLFSEAFKRPVWGAEMGPYEQLRDELNRGFLHLDPVQLTKHAFAIREQSTRLRKIGVLIYLFAEPPAFHNGAAIFPDAHAHHRQEVTRFAEAVQGGEVQFCHLTYRELLENWSRSSDPALVEHAEVVAKHYRLWP